MKIVDGLKAPPRLDRILVPFFQSNRPWLCTDIVAYSDSDQGRSILLVDRNEPPVRGVLWLPGGGKPKNVGLEAFVNDKMVAECGVGIGKDVRLVRQLGAWDFSTADDLPLVPGLGVVGVDNGFHAVSINYLVEVSPDATDRIRVDSTSARHHWFNMARLRAYGASIGGFHPYFAETVNAAAPELGLNPKLALAEVNVAKYGSPVDNFEG